VLAALPAEAGDLLTDDIDYVFGTIDDLGGAFASESDSPAEFDEGLGSEEIVAFQTLLGEDIGRSGFSYTAEGAELSNEISGLGFSGIGVFLGSGEADGEEVDEGCR
jgi:hypothetical protein